MSWAALALQSVRAILVAGGIVVVVVLALKIGALLLEPRLAFFPVPKYAETPGSLGLPFEAIELKPEDGVRLRGWFVPAPRDASREGKSARRPPLTVLFFHGNAENIGGCLDLARLMREAGYQLLLVDYRGYGESAGRPSETGLYRDGRAALAYLRSRADVDPSRIVVWGRSIGASVAVVVAAGESPAATSSVPDSPGPAGVILESAFTSIPELLRSGGHWLLYAASRFGTYRFDSAARIGRLRCPLLALHGTADEIASFELGRRLFDLAPGRKEFVAIEGGGHNDLWALHEQTMWDAVSRFLRELE